MRRHTDWYNIVLRANRVKLRRKMAAMTVEDKKTIPPLSPACSRWNKKLLEPVKTYFIGCPSIITQFEAPV